MKIGDFGLSKTMADTHPEGVPWLGKKEESAGKLSLCFFFGCLLETRYSK